MEEPYPAANRFHRLMVAPDASILQALRAIDDGVAGLALVVTDSLRLVGVVTDGDLRRALLGGASLQDEITDYTRQNPVTVSPDVGRALVIDLMRARRISQIPVVSDDGVVCGLHLLTDVIAPKALPNLAVVMAGGRGTRLGELTTRTPKPMVPVAGRPILEWIVLHLVHEGIRDIVISVGYLAEQIEAHFTDGSGFGCRIRYVRDEPGQPRGSGGALADLSPSWLGAEPLLVMNGDLLTRFALAQMLQRHHQSAATITIATREISHEVPFGVVETDESGMLRALREKPRVSWTVNAGVYFIAPSALRHIATKGEYPLTELVERCMRNGETVSTWSLRDDWVDIGQPIDLARARGLGS